MRKGTQEGYGASVADFWVVLCGKKQRRSYQVLLFCWLDDCISPTWLLSGFKNGLHKVQATGIKRTPGVPFN